MGAQNDSLPDKGHPGSLRSQDTDSRIGAPAARCRFPSNGHVGAAGNEGPEAMPALCGGR